METYKMYINGQWKESHLRETIEVINPSDSSVFAAIQRGGKEDVDQAVSAALNAFQSAEWKAIKPHERGYILYEMAAKIRENKNELARLETFNVGKPLSQGYADVEAAARYFEFYAGVADKIMGETIPVEQGILDYTVREPIGVTAHIIPWNYPIQIASRSTAAAIAAGNAVVMKPAEETPSTAVKLAEYFDEMNLPKGIFNLITGYGHEAGAALSSHKDVNHITFTGSLATGISVMESAAKNVVPVTLELGGKSPNIVFSDSNLEEAAQWVVQSIVQNAGQTCSAGSRLLVESKTKGLFLEKIIDRFKKLNVGPGLNDPNIGPIISKKQFETIMKYISLAEKEARIVTGGTQLYPKGGESGYYINPTIIDNISEDSVLVKEEIFGPVLTVQCFETEEEAIKMANSTEYGLVTGIWTNDLKRAHRIADQVKSGQVFINNYGAGGGIQMPFGGYKKSGFGREKGLEALQNYTILKNVALKYI